MNAIAILRSPKDLRKVIQLRHTQMEVKRANDPIKQQILVASEKFRGGPKDDKKEADDEKEVQPPTLPAEDGIGIFDVFTTHSAKNVLQFIQEFSTAQFAFTPVIDMEGFTVMLYFNLTLILAFLLWYFMFCFVLF